MKTKTVQIFLIFLLSTATLFSQDVLQSDVPSIIVNNFKKEFPKASNVEWEIKNNQYNVDFKIGWFTDFDAWFTQEGKLVKYTEEISNSKLPKKIKEYVKNNFADFKIEDAKKVVTNGVLTYKIEIEKRNFEQNLIFSKNGTIINTKH